jgi:hypothetical protein
MTSQSVCCHADSPDEDADACRSDRLAPGPGTGATSNEESMFIKSRFPMTTTM